MHIDLNAYFARIAYAGPRAATLGTLQDLHRLHPQAIPFENLDPLLKRPVLLDPQAVEDKLVRQGRGGYCYEHNGLFKRVLEELGFHVTGLIARVLWNMPEDSQTPRSHMLMRVQVGSDSYIADVGFGGLVLTAPLLLEAGEQQTPHELYRLQLRGGYYFVQAKIDAEWRSLYRFDLTEQYNADYEIPNWFACTHPSSRFTTNLVAARAMPNVRYALLNNQLSTHRLNAGTTRENLHNARMLGDCLKNVFGISLPDDVELPILLERFAA